MKKAIASALFMAAVAVSPGASAADSEGIKQFTVNEVIVYPIMDSSGSMDASLFSGPLSEQEKLAYMPEGKAPSSVNIFLLKTPAGNVLIDAGWGLSGSGGKGVTERLPLSGLTADDINVVILTHAHPDHIGGLLNGKAAFFPKARLMLSTLELAASGGAPVIESAAVGAEELAADPAENSAGGAASPPVEAAVSPPPPRNEMAQAVFEAYKGRLETFEWGAEILPGLTALDARGHTPGHTVFHLKNGDKELLFIGDILHAAALQFPEPDECASFDSDKTAAITSRKNFLNKASTENLPIAGAHIPFPGMGFVKPDEKRGFVFTPVTEEK